MIILWLLRFHTTALLKCECSHMLDSNTFNCIQHLYKWSYSMFPSLLTTRQGVGPYLIKLQRI